jgi:transposase
LARRARLILLCGDGLASNVVARKLHVRDQTVSKWRARFVRDRLDGLYDEPRPGAPRTINDAIVERVVIRTLETTPRGQTHWSLRGMAQATGLSRMTISRIWHAFGLQPHRSETFKLSPDPLLVEKVRDIVGLYMNPPDHAVVLCVDEKAQIQALDRTQPLLPMRPGQSERRTHDYRLGAAITVFTGASAWRSGGCQLLLGLAAAALTFGVGKLIGIALSAEAPQRPVFTGDTASADAPASDIFLPPAGRTAATPPPSPPPA